MEKLVKIGVLLVALCARASSLEPSIFQYWFDDHEELRNMNTFVYNSQTNPLSIDVSDLPEGVHTVHYRMANRNNQWGGVLTKYFTVPHAPDLSTSKPKSYRLLMNSKVIEKVPINYDTNIALTKYFPEDPELGVVSTREFSFNPQDQTLTMDATGTFSIAMQMLSENDEWGMPLISEFPLSITTTIPVDSVPVPYDYTFIQPEINSFKAYRFFNNTNSSLYFRVSHDCNIGFYCIDSMDSSKLVLLYTCDLHRNSMTILNGDNLKNKDLFFIIFGSKSSFETTQKEMTIRIMYDDDKLPKPVVKFDPSTWEVTMSCADERATIHYTLDGSDPNSESSTYVDPVFIDKPTTVKAFASYGDLKDSKVEELVINESDIRIPRPELKFVGGENMNEFILTNRIDGVTTYYVIGDGDIADDSQRIIFDGNPFVIEDGSNLKAYSSKEMYMDSELLSMRVYLEAFITPAPDLIYIDGYVFAMHDDSSVSICFSDDSGNPIEPEPEDSRRVKVSYGSIVDAYAFKEGYVPSKTVRISPTENPIISVDKFKVSIASLPNQTIKYTLDGSQPDLFSTIYSGQFKVRENCTVRAVAFQDRMIPSEADPVTIEYHKNRIPEFHGYDGRFLTLSVESGSTIRYVVGDMEDVSKGKLADGLIDVEGLTKITAISQSPDADDSDLFTFIPEYYANNTDVYTTNPGDLEKAFEWNYDMTSISSLKVHGPLVGSSPVDSGDYAFLKSQPNLTHLDLSEVTDSYIPEGALGAPGLLSIVLPEQMKSVGGKLFGESNSTLCALEAPGNDLLPESLLIGIQNSNLLLYVKNANFALQAISKTNGLVKNIVELGGSEGTNRADNVTLTHALPFYAHKAFEAGKISFTRSFSKQTQIGGYGSGWETLTVPFRVDKIESAGKVLKPFEEADMERGECPFWLFRAADTDWTASSTIVANTPYLIAMPNHPYYADEFVVNGDVVFSSNDVTVPVTPVADAMTSSFGVGRALVGNYSWISKEEGKLAVNEAVASYSNVDFQPGGIFISGERDISPFECYVESPGAKAIPVFDCSAVEYLLGDYGTRIWGESHSVCIRSGIALKLRIYNIVGQLIRIVDVPAGETVKVDCITPGIYFVGNTKILVKG